MGKHTCTKCNRAETSDVLGIYEEDVFTETDGVVTCNGCNAPSVYVPVALSKPRKVDGEFDFLRQAFITKGGMVQMDDGSLVNPDAIPRELCMLYEGEMPCPKCHGPATCTAVDSWHEHYTCLNCAHTFTGC